VPNSISSSDRFGSRASHGDNALAIAVRDSDGDLRSNNLSWGKLAHPPCRRIGTGVGPTHNRDRSGNAHLSPTMRDGSGAKRGHNRKPAWF
jgi:hypothetical protein